VKKISDKLVYNDIWKTVFGRQRVTLMTLMNADNRVGGSSYVKRWSCASILYCSLLAVGVIPVIRT